MHRLRITVLTVALVVIVAPAFGAATPNSLFSDGAVLQRGISVPVWGTASDGERVTVEFNGQTVSTFAKDGKWMVRLEPMPAGGPYTMTINGLQIKDVLVGEVWVCSGQSNMEFGLSRAANGQQAIAASADPQLRLITAARNAQTAPISDIKSGWKVCGPDTVGNFTAVGYFFGRDLRRALGVPVGLIDSSWGGTYVQAWTSTRCIPNASELRWRARKNANWATSPNRPGVLYNGMIAPLIPYAIRGAIWYQGESNAGEAYAYRTMFPNMIECWREDWGQGDFPFLFVQLAPFQKIADQPQESAWAELREAQLLTSLNSPKTGMAVITDCGDPNDIHPTQKEPVGARLALAALGIAYDQPVVYSGPVYKSVKIKGSNAIVSFGSVGGGLVAKGGELTGFTIAGEDRKFYNASAKIVGNTVVVSSPEVPHPMSVRYGWADCPVVNLYNKEGLPASPFRTDSFPMVTGPK